MPKTTTKKKRFAIRDITPTNRELVTFVNVGLQRMSDRHYQNYAISLAVVLLSQRLQRYIEEFNTAMKIVQKERDGDTPQDVIERREEFLDTDVELRELPVIAMSEVLEIWLTTDDDGTEKVRRVGGNWNGTEIRSLLPFVDQDLDLIHILELAECPDDSAPDAADESE
jgi:hypothetical protein